MLQDGVPADEAGRTGTTNGAAMRVTPVGIATPAEDLHRLVDAVVATARVTHNTSLGIAAAAAVAAAVSAGVDGASLPEALDAGERAAVVGGERGHWAPGGEIAARIHWARGWVRGMEPDAVADAVARVIGTSVASQESVVAAFALAEAMGDDPPAALRLAAGLGGDTDTVAAICGAMLGAAHGVDAFRPDVVETVLSVNRLEFGPLVDELLALSRRDRAAGAHRAGRPRPAWRDRPCPSRAATSWRLRRICCPAAVSTSWRRPRAPAPACSTRAATAPAPSAISCVPP